jgi:hypothetical protein
MRMESACRGFFGCGKVTVASVHVRLGLSDHKPICVFGYDAFEVLVVKPRTLPEDISLLLAHALVEHEQLQFVGTNLVQEAISAALAARGTEPHRIPPIPSRRESRICGCYPFICCCRRTWTAVFTMCPVSIKGGRLQQEGLWRERVDGHDGDDVDAGEDRDGGVDAGDHSPRAGGDPAVAASSRGRLEEGEEAWHGGWLMVSLG